MLSRSDRRRCVPPSPKANRLLLAGGEGGGRLGKSPGVRVRKRTDRAQFEPNDSVLLRLETGSCTAGFASAPLPEVDHHWRAGISEEARDPDGRFGRAVEKAGFRRDLNGLLA